MGEVPEWKATLPRTEYREKLSCTTTSSAAGSSKGTGLASAPMAAEARVHCTRKNCYFFIIYY